MIVERLRQVLKELDADRRLGPVLAVQRVRRRAKDAPMTDSPELEALFAAMPDRYRHERFKSSSVASYYYDVRDMPGAVGHWFEVAGENAERGLR